MQPRVEAANHHVSRSVTDRIHLGAHQRRASESITGPTLTRLRTRDLGGGRGSAPPFHHLYETPRRDPARAQRLGAKPVLSRLLQSGQGIALEGGEVRLERTTAAPGIQPPSLARRGLSPWFGAARAIVHPVVDGLFYHVVQFEGHDWAHYGRFIALDRPRRIEHTWVSEATRGLKSVVTLTLEPQGNQTLVKLRHANVPDDELGRRHEEGWGFVLGAIADRFTKHSAKSK